MFSIKMGVEYGWMAWYVEQLLNVLVISRMILCSFLLGRLTPTNPNWLVVWNQFGT